MAPETQSIDFQSNLPALGAIPYASFQLRTRRTLLCRRRGPQRRNQSVSTSMTTTMTMTTRK
jgi:hypothetical protein